MSVTQNVVKGLLLNPSTVLVEDPSPSLTFWVWMTRF